MIVDAHVHLLRHEGYDHQLARAARAADIGKMALMGGPKQYDYASNADVLAAAERHPDLFVPFAWFRLGRDYAAMVDEYHSRGFHGLYFALPQSNYDDKEFYLVYAAAGRLGMPSIFELGLLPNSGRDHLHNVCCSTMRPIALDTIARAFPELVLIGSRMGNPWYEEACEVARCNTNVYLGLSGTTLRKKGPEFFRQLLWWGDDGGTYNGTARGLPAWKKVLFASNVHAKHLAAVRKDYERLMAALDLDVDTCADIFARNAIRALALEY